MGFGDDNIKEWTGMGFGEDNIKEWMMGIGEDNN